MSTFQRATFLQAALVIGLVTALGAQAPAPASPAGAHIDGHQLFKTFCASCHGENGHGNGPAAETLRHVPPDLSRFAAKNGGVFPSERLARIIDGRDVPSHGNNEMPVWGDAFRILPEGASAETVKARIAAVVKFLDSIQARSGH